VRSISFRSIQERHPQVDCTADRRQSLILYLVRFQRHVLVLRLGLSRPRDQLAAAGAIMDLSGPSGEAPYNNHWSHNTYDGPWVLRGYVQGSSNVKADMFPAGVAATVDFNDWQSIYHRDADSTTDPDLSGLVDLGGTMPFGCAPHGDRGWGPRSLPCMRRQPGPVARSSPPHGGAARPHGRLRVRRRRGRPESGPR
jgi:hypothetical protein